MTTTNGEQHYPGAEDIRGDLSRLDFDPDFARLLEAKSVIVVGPAETMLGTNRGREIDSFDLVVRFNTAIEYMPFAHDLAKDVGARTDILYCNSEVLRDRIARRQGLSHERFVRACAEAGIKYFVGVNNDFTHGASDEHGAKGSAVFFEFQKFLDERGVRARPRMLFSTPAVLREWLRGYIGRTGFIAIVDLLRYNVSRLHVTGMTFYHKGGHLFLEDCVGELDPLRNHKGILPENMLGHNSYSELRIIETLRDCFADKLELDGHVRELLKTGGGDGRASGD